MKRCTEEKASKFSFINTTLMVSGPRLDIHIGEKLKKESIQWSKN